MTWYGTNKKIALLILKFQPILYAKSLFRGEFSSPDPFILADLTVVKNVLGFSRTLHNHNSIFLANSRSLHDIVLTEDLLSPLPLSDLGSQNGESNDLNMVNQEVYIH